MRAPTVVPGMNRCRDRTRDVRPYGCSRECIVVETGRAMRAPTVVPGKNRCRNRTRDARPYELA